MVTGLIKVINDGFYLKHQGMWLLKLGVGLFTAEKKKASDRQFCKVQKIPSFSKIQNIPLGQVVKYIKKKLKLWMWIDFTFVSEHGTFY